MVDCFISHSNTTEVNFYLLLFASDRHHAPFFVSSVLEGDWQEHDRPSQVIEDTLRDEDPLILRRKT